MSVLSDDPRVVWIAYGVLHVQFAELQSAEKIRLEYTVSIGEAKIKPSLSPVRERLGEKMGSLWGAIKVSSE